MMHPTYPLLISLLKAHTSKKKLNILDYGCGMGLLLEYLPSRMIKSYIGVDLNTESIASAQKRYKKNHRLKFETIKKNTLHLKKESIDAVFVIGVLQYMTTGERKELFKKIKQCLAPGGKIYVSCAAKHLIYEYTDLYRVLLQHTYIDRKTLVQEMKQSGLKVKQSFERGLCIAPLFSHGIVVLFDLLDKVLFRTHGTLGPIGRWSRAVIAPLLALEFKLPIDYGYTLFCVAADSR